MLDPEKLDHAIERIREYAKDNLHKIMCDNYEWMMRNGFCIIHTPDYNEKAYLETLQILRKYFSDVGDHKRFTDMSFYLDTFNSKRIQIDEYISEFCLGINLN